MRHHARLCALVFVALFFASSADFNRCLAQTPTPTPSPTPTPIQAGQVIISEFRLRGPAGTTDEFIEIYNNTDAPIIVQATDASSGWAVSISNGEITGNLFVIPNGTLIPARGHYLGGHATGYSLCNYPSGYGPGGPSTTAPPSAAVAAPCVTNGISGFPHTTPDQNWELDVPDGAGVALFTTANGPAQTAATRLDAVGFTSSPALYREGAGLPTVVTLNFEHTYYRDQRNGTPRDTENNGADFLLVGTSGGAPGLQSIPLLGAPGPENRNSPVQMNSGFTASLLDPDAGVSQPPNRSRDFTSDPTNNSDFGTLLIRRTITNNTGQPVSRLRFRVVNITTLGTPAIECQGTPCADLRVRSSEDSEVNVDGQLVQVRGLRLEEPPEQAAGGGYNSSLSADFITIQQTLDVGESVNIEFRLGVMRTGPFRFFVNIEAQNSSNIILLRSTAPGGEGADVGVGGKQRRVMMEAQPAAPAAGVPAPSPAAAPRRTIYVPLFINARPPASNPARAPEEKADDERKEKESNEAAPPAPPAPETPAASNPDSPAAAADEPAPAAAPRATPKKRPAAAKASRRGGNR